MTRRSSLLSLANLVLVITLPLPESRQIIQICDVVLSGILLLDFGFRLSVAPSRRDYLIRQYGWLDLLVSLPVQRMIPGWGAVLLGWNLDGSR